MSGSRYGTYVFNKFAHARAMSDAIGREAIGRECVPVMATDGEMPSHLRGMTFKVIEVLADPPKAEQDSGAMRFVLECTGNRGFTRGVSLEYTYQHCVNMGIAVRSSVTVAKTSTPRNSLKGARYSFAYIALVGKTEDVVPQPEAVPAPQPVAAPEERRHNFTGRALADTAAKYKISWQVLGGAVIVPGTRQTYAHRLDFKYVGAEWDSTQHAWKA